MFFAIELQTSGEYVLFQPQGLFKPSNLLIRDRKIALHDENVAFSCANTSYRSQLGLSHGQRGLVVFCIG